MYLASKRTILFGLMLVLLVSLSLSTVVAQEGFGEGGVVVWGNQRGSANIDPLNPLRCSGVDCSDINGLIYPSLVGLDPATLTLQPNIADGLAASWEISEDGTEYTFFLRDDFEWSDGTPLTATDVWFTWAAIQNVDPGEISSSLATIRQEVVDVEIIDDYTVKLTYASPICTALNRASELSVVPSHIYGYVPGEEYDWSTIIGHPMDTEPAVSAGPFIWNRTDAGTAIYLAPNPTYTDPSNGEYVAPTGLVYLDVADYNIMAERLLAGQANDVNYMHEPDVEVLPTLQDGGANVFVAPGNLWHYVSLNLADPNNPTNGLDEDGNPIEQAPHPILGDKRVRQALQHAVDIQSIIDGPLNGNGTAMVAGTGPNAFTFNENLVRRPFDLDAARALLDEAGWEASGEPLVEGGDGLRIATDDALYADAGTEFVINMVNPGDVRNDVAVLLQASFAEIGVLVDVETG